MSTAQAHRVLAAVLAIGLSACASAPEKVGRPVATKSPAGLSRTLEDHTWTLDSATDGQGRRIEAVSPGSTQQLRSAVFSFSGTRVSIQGSCNRWVGGYEINPAGQLKVGSLASTMMACEPALMQADAALSALLAKPLNVERVAGASPGLRLTTATNETLVLTGQMTPQARYGAAELIFLEVAAQPVACTNPFSAEPVCLQVRERRYDEQGLVVGTPGEWRPLYENIDGFTHRTGERNVLRIKRFNRNPAPAGASSTVLVLDLMVESQTMPR